MKLFCSVCDPDADRRVVMRSRRPLAFDCSNGISYKFRGVKWIAPMNWVNGGRIRRGVSR